MQSSSAIWKTVKKCFKTLEINNLQEQKMSESDKLVFEKTEILSVLKKINFILLSLHKIGSFYNDIDIRTYEHWTTDFIDSSRVTSLLSDVRRVLSSQFSNELGDDDMSELERAMEDIEYWQRPSD